ncbi:MAG TPA: hypothetical protein PL124_10490 [Candidatus Cloacimonadota bacterium]|nr:hypothetical protein [Candidatus Cloacimonadota bacterium]
MTHQVVSKTTKYRIFMDVAGQRTDEPIYHDVMIHSTGVITLKEGIQKYFGYIPLNSSVSHSWEEFAGKHPDDARLIKEFDAKHGRRT